MGLLCGLKAGVHDERLAAVYPERGAAWARDRCIAAVERFKGLFGGQSGCILLSAPGRTEIGGNHTDHNHGRVLAGAVSLDMLSVAAPAQDYTVELLSEGFPLLRLNLSLLSPIPAETGTSAALIRGIAAGMAKRGYKIGGFRAYITSDVLKGSGLSSSAAFEVLIVAILNHLYNAGAMRATEAAILSQFAENIYFGKPCGLMDQMASATGGFVAMDFQDNENPVVEAIPFDLAATRHTLCIVDTKGDHQDLTAEYAAIPAEMKAVAALFNKSVLRDVEPAAVYENAPRIRAALGDRALLRAIHFIEEDRRAAAQAAALKAGNFPELLRLMHESGRSSALYLQNVWVAGAVREQPMSVALCLSERILGRRGALRVHGGGFAGTVQALVPNDLLPAYQKGMEALFGPGSCFVLSIRKDGGVRLI